MTVMGSDTSAVSSMRSDASSPTTLFSFSEAVQATIKIAISEPRTIFDTVMVLLRSRFDVSENHVDLGFHQFVRVECAFRKQ